VRDSIQRISLEASEVESYIMRQAQSQSEIVQTKHFAMALSKQDEVHPCMARAILKDLCTCFSVSSLSRTQQSQAVGIFCSKRKEPASFYNKGYALSVQGGIYLLYKTSLHKVTPLQDLAFEGEIQSGALQLSWKESIFEKMETFSWKDLLTGGKCRLYVPKGNFGVQSMTSRQLDQVSYAIRSLPILRPFIPGITQGIRLVGDFLTGYTIPLKKGDQCIEICGFIV
jgi:hypothetical protein